MTVGAVVPLANIVVSMMTTSAALVTCVFEFGPDFAVGDVGAAEEEAGVWEGDVVGGLEVEAFGGGIWSNWIL